MYEFETLKKVNGSIVIRVPLPEKIHPELNPDGSEPVATIFFNTEADSAIALYTLTQMGKDQSFFTDAGYGFAADNYPDGIIDDWENTSTEECNAVFYHKYDPFITAELLTANVGLEDGTNFPVSVNITAPSGIAVAYALAYATDPQYIMHLSLQIMSEHSDEDEDEED